MRWPWQRKSSQDQFIVSWAGQTFAYVRARPGAGGNFRVLMAGVERQGEGGMDELVQRLQALGLKGLQAKVMLCPEQYQLLQIEAPAVAPEELRSAARYQIRDMVSAHIDDITLDVMRVGDGLQKGPGHLFVVAATNAVIRDVMALGEAMSWPLKVIDIQENAQRNLQNLQAARANLRERAHATLMLAEGHQAVFTISANDELFYTRRLDLPAGFMGMKWSRGARTEVPADTGFTPVQEYVPDYSVGGESFGTDYSAPAHHDPSGSGNADDEAELERAQRFVVEVQRSLDLWDRSWSHMPLHGVHVYAGARSGELAQWLSRETGQNVSPLDVDALMPGLDTVDGDDRALCAALCGVLLRIE